MNDRDLIARKAIGSCAVPLEWKHATQIADAVLAAIGDRLIPGIPDYIQRLTITTHNWSVDFYAPSFPNDNGEIWQDVTGDDQPVEFAIAASVCDIPGADGWFEWDCYPDSAGWIVFADNNGETGHPQGTGPTISAAIRDALEGKT